MLLSPLFFKNAFRLLPLALLLLAQPALAQRKSQRVAFAGFGAVIADFYSECYSYSRLGEDGKKAKNRDTVFICETPCDEQGWYVNGQTITLSSKTAADRFDIEVATEYDINQQFDDRDGKEPQEGWDAWSRKAQNWRYLSAYKKLARLSANRFRLPGRRELSAKQDLKEIRRRYGLRDTLIAIPREVGATYLEFAKGDRLFSNSPSNLRLRVKRYSETVLKETRYIVIGLSEGCD